MCACYIRTPTQQSAQKVDCNNFLSILNDGDGGKGEPAVKHRMLEEKFAVTAL